MYIRSKPLSVLLLQFLVMGLPLTFLLLNGDGSVVTWGRGLQAELQDVLQIQATSSAFAAILGNGSA
eukprot:s84_g16.t1